MEDFFNGGVREYMCSLVFEKTFCNRIVVMSLPVRANDSGLLLNVSVFSLSKHYKSLEERNATSKSYKHAKTECIVSAPEL